MTSIDEVSAYPPEPERVRFAVCLGCDATVEQRPNSAGRLAPLICEACAARNAEQAREWYAHCGRAMEAA